MAYTAPTGDFVTTTLNGAITAAATSATIGTGLNIPAANGILQIDYDSSTAVGADNGPETVSYTAYDSGTGAVSGMARGIDANTTGVAHANGAKVQCGPSSMYFGNGVIGNTDLSPSAITLGYAEITSNFTHSATPTITDVTNLDVTVTVPAGGRRIKITAFTKYLSTSNGTAGTSISWYIREGATTLAEAFETSGGAGYGHHMTVTSSFIPAAGAHTYKVSCSQGAAGTQTVAASATAPAFILVELI